MRIADNIDNIFLALSKDLLKAPQVGNTRELNNVRITLKDITKNIVSVRDLSPSYLFGELLWYFNGDESLDFISNYSSFWKNISDDGETCNSAYGYLMQCRDGFNQIEKVIDILTDDPESRRAKINVNVPNVRVKETLDEPCTMSLHFMIRKGNLDCTAIMRSNDIWFGFPYDAAFFTTLQKYIAMRLNVGYGWYTHFAVSLHMYDRDAEKLAQIVNNPISRPIRFDDYSFFKNFNYIFDSLKVAKKYDMNVKEMTMRLMHELCGYDKEEKLCSDS